MATATQPGEAVKLATARSELDQIIESRTQRHAAYVESREALGAPFFGLVVKDEVQA